MRSRFNRLSLVVRPPHDVDSLLGEEEVEVSGVKIKKGQAWGLQKFANDSRLAGPRRPSPKWLNVSIGGEYRGRL